jgi:hypothetical protein
MDIQAVPVILVGHHDELTQLYSKCACASDHMTVNTTALFHIQGVTGGKDQTSGECSLC